MTIYYGVLGNRDHIKRHKGTDREYKAPFYDYLDEHPKGWLSSHAYKVTRLPKSKYQILDCGAWSYREQEVPPVDAASMAAWYDSLAQDEAMVIAPDHMVIDPSVAAYRREWNREQAAMFIDLCPERLLPMACVHGTTTEERLVHAEELLSLGYAHLAIGGVAAQASRKPMVLALVAALRAAMPNVWLHVLGLSSPFYFAEWTRIGIDGCDGSSHFKQAFTAGAFFTVEGPRLIKHKAAKGDEPITAPDCFCRACRTLAEEGIDTRRYGSNENNMGRAAHNLNMLMRAQKEAVNALGTSGMRQEQTTLAL